jgi:N-methylhydantoinase B
MRPGDVFETSWQGGGGFGDPLARDPASVAYDVTMGHLSEKFAADIYGVAISASGEANEVKTLQKRSSIKAIRLATAKSPIAQHTGFIECDRVIGGALFFGRKNGQRWFGCSCGQALAPTSGAWRSGAARRCVDPDEINPAIRLQAELEMRQYLCPSCGVSLSVDVSLRTAEDFHDISLHEPS